MSTEWETDEEQPPKPLTHEEVLKWPALGPMNLDPRRVLMLVERAELAEAERDADRAALDAQRAALAAAVAGENAARAEAAMLREALESVRDGIECESVGKGCDCARCRAAAALASPSSAERLAEHDRRIRDDERSQWLSAVTAPGLPTDHPEAMRPMFEAIAARDRRVWREAMEACAAAVRASRERLSAATLDSIAREVLAVRGPNKGPVDHR